ncbi:TFIIH/NER complex ATP-dependent 5'-3' DNA helicase subunit, variant 3 [Entomophthora muscae]|nr:TFIIH/NER complex ATP-dependent 5'-3' DNA helicase subunit, variant 3 [Entomophthora muscae]
MEYRKSHGCVDANFLGLGLTSRKNLCLNPRVASEKRGKLVDSKCRNLTASWIRNRVKAQGCSNGDIEQLCSHYENLQVAINENEQEGGESPLPSGVYTLEELKELCREKTLCPYYLARKMILAADVIIYSFHYLLDPKVAELISRDLPKDSIIVFDEAHNIDNVCLESLSIDIDRPSLEASARSVIALAEKVAEVKQTDAQRLQDEYSRLVEGLQEARSARDEDRVMANPALPTEVLEEAVPGNIRKAEHFVAFLRRFIEYLKTRLRVMHVVAESPDSFMRHLKDVTYIERRPLRMTSERLSALVRTLELNDLEEYTALQKVASFATLVSSYDKGFLLILEPFETDAATVPNPIFHLVCLDASLAIGPVFSRFESVVITSGTLSPPEMYPRILGFEAAVMASYSMTLTRNCFLPIIVTRGSDQVAISSKFEVRNDPAVVRNFGNILVEFAKSVPDGVVAFFPSYLYMESIVALWNDMGILAEVWRHKLIFVETPDAAETSLALENYRTACDNGRGAVLLSVARGKVSEGIDFDHNYGRAVLMFGIPFQYTESRILKARLEYLRDNHHIRENDYLSFDAMRHAAQCVGRVLRGKTDYGLMVFADKRFARNDKRSKLPRWIQQYTTESSVNVSTDMAIVMAKKFLRAMAQPDTDHQAQLGISLWTEEDILRKFGAQKNGPAGGVNVPETIEAS